MTGIGFLIADGPPPWLDTNIIFLLVAGLIALIGRVVSAVNEHRKRTAVAQRKKEQQTSVTFEEQAEVREEYAPPLPSQPAARAPQPPTARLQLGVPARGPKPPSRRRPAPKPRSVARPTARKPAAAQPLGLQAVLELGRDPTRARDALILREVLGPPMSLRSRSPLERR